VYRRLKNDEFVKQWPVAVTVFTADVPAYLVLLQGHSEIAFVWSLIPDH
jgi:hypothetical protein